MDGHSNLVARLFEQSGLDLGRRQQSMLSFLASPAVQLAPVDMGFLGLNVRGETVGNQCFYLSLAAAKRISLREKLFGLEDEVSSVDRHLSIHPVVYLPYLPTF